MKLEEFGEERMKDEAGTKTPAKKLPEKTVAHGVNGETRSTASSVAARLRICRGL